MIDIHSFTSESVTEGHPDKICDQISDSILDKFLTNDPESRVACETLASTGMIIISGALILAGGIALVGTPAPEGVERNPAMLFIPGIIQIALGAIKIKKS